MPITEILNKNAELYPDDIALVEINPKNEADGARVTWRDYSLIEADPDCNAVRIYSPVQPDGTGMIEAGTEYEVWGLIREA